MGCRLNEEALEKTKGSAFLGVKHSYFKYLFLPPGLYSNNPDRFSLTLLEKLVVKISNLLSIIKYKLLSIVLSSKHSLSVLYMYSVSSITAAKTPELITLPELFIKNSNILKCK